MRVRSRFPSVRFPRRRRVRSRFAVPRDMLILLVVAMLIRATGALAAPAPAPEPQTAPAAGQPAFDAARAWSHLQKQVALGPRPSGSAALKTCRDYIASELKKIGIE